MSAIYLIRHGQAGSRSEYDALSDLGRRQSRLLGEYLAAQKVAFAAVYTGALNRQCETAEEALSAYRQAGLVSPALIVDPRWNEFDLGRVLESFAPRLSADDAEFRRQYVSSRDSRHWTYCDIAAVEAWIEERYPFDGESWRKFRERTSSCIEALGAHNRGEVAAVFTSATPIAVWVGLALGLADGKVMSLAGVTFNSSFTTLQLRDGELRLFSFNNVPHLTDPALRTFR